MRPTTSVSKSRISCRAASNPISCSTTCKIWTSSDWLVWNAYRGRLLPPPCFALAHVWSGWRWAFEHSWRGCWQDLVKDSKRGIGKTTYLYRAISLATLVTKTPGLALAIAASACLAVLQQSATGVRGRPYRWLGTHLGNIHVSCQMDHYDSHLSASLLVSNSPKSTLETSRWGSHKVNPRPIRSMAARRRGVWLGIVSLGGANTKYIKALAVRRTSAGWRAGGSATLPPPDRSCSRSKRAPRTPQRITAVVWFRLAATALGSPSSSGLGIKWCLVNS